MLMAVCHAQAVKHKVLLVSVCAVFRVSTLSFVFAPAHGSVVVRTSEAIACFAVRWAFLSSDIRWGVPTMAMFATVGTWSGFIGLHAIGHIVLFAVAILASGSIDALAVE